MIGLGTVFIGIMAYCAFRLKNKKLFAVRHCLWMLFLSVPFPYIANIARWYTAELGRQPWLVYGLMRVSEGSSTQISAGNALFTLLGFAGLYVFLGALFILVLFKLIFAESRSFRNAELAEKRLFFGLYYCFPCF